MNEHPPDHLVRVVGSLDPVTLDLEAWRHCRRGRDVLDLPAVAFVPTRWVDVGDPGVLHLADGEDGMWAEARKHAPPGIDLTEYGQTVARIRVRARALDLCSAAGLSALGVETADLIRNDDVAVCRDLARAARVAGHEALVTPSATHPTARTIVAFGIGGLTVVHQAFRTPPP